jgi:uncharacterized protein YacL
MALIILRCVFLLVAAGTAVSIVNSRLLVGAPVWAAWLVLLGVMAVAFAVIGLDMVVPRKRVDTISCVYFGLIVGFFLTYAVSIALEPLMQTLTDKLIEGVENREQYGSFVQGVVQLVLGMILCYTCVSLLIQTKDDFRFIIPYVEFSKDVKGLKPYILDTSVVIDGRIADVVETRVLDNQIIMPRFILAELQGIADSSDKLRRSRGRRGLDILNRLRADERVDLKIHDHESPEMANQPVDMKLVLLAKQLEGKVVTGDYNLNKVARLHSVEVINLNDVANALKPIYLPGEKLRVKLVKPGEEEGQGVGYLDDGTMIVVENGRRYVGQLVQIEVTSILQTSAGRMIFGKFSARAGAES